MGAVYRAYDEELEREVALKLLHESAANNERRRSRLMREAQAMAKLAHPNVIPVFDVGFRDEADAIYVAMELVEGHDLKAWLAQRDRHWRVVVDVFLQAGRGLVAAHRAGLVHRDFKPANVLVGVDGRVRVVDFGVARLGRHAVVSPDDDEQVDEAALSVVAEELTRAGGVLGTPAYIAPEHYAGGEADARSDQFAFCVSLWEGLYGQRPFVAPLMPDLIAKILRGTPDDPPPGRRLPSRLRRLLLRGLARNPRRRFDSMEALLEELRRIRHRSRRFTVIGVAVAAAVGSSIGAVVLSRGLGGPTEVCTAGEERLAAVWGTAHREALDPTVGERLDAYGSAWVAAYTEACEATQVRGEQSSELLDRRMACLDGTLRELGALAEVLSSAATVEDPIEATHRLPPIARCGDTEALVNALPQEDVPDGLQANFDRAVALRRAGRYDDAAALAADVVARAEPPRFLARALLVQGELSDMVGRTEQARALLEDAAARAADAGDTRTTAQSLALLLYVHGVSRGDPQSALTLAPAADAVARLSGDDAVLASLHNNLGAAHYRSGDAEAAERHFGEAVRLRSRALGDEHPAVARSLHNQVAALRTLDRVEDAAALVERIDAIVAVAYPAEHPKVADVRSLEASLASHRGDAATAVTKERAALAIAKAALGPDHPAVGERLVNIAAYELAAGRPAEALPFAERASALFDRILPADHPHRANALTVKGDCLAALDRHEEAVLYFEAALETGSDERSLPLDRANVRLGLALSLNALGRDPKRVRALAQASLPAYRKAGTARWIEAAEDLLKE